MGYTIVDIDVSDGIDAADATGEQGPSDGVGLLLRDGDRPLAFVLRPVSADAVDAELVTDLAVRHGSHALLRERLRRGLPRSGAAAEPGPGSVTVAVCTRNRPEDLARCLDAIHEAQQRSGLDVDVLVVDNAPPDDRTRELVAGLGFARYACEPVAGLDVARNRALAEARGDWLLFVDDDVRVDPTYLLGWAAARHEHPDAAGVVGLVLPAELSTRAQLRFESKGGFGRGCEPLRWDGRYGPAGRLHPIGAGIFGAGCDMGFAVAVLRELGGFDVALDTGPPLPGGGDLDIFFRVLAAGHTLVYEPRMVVFHRHRREIDELERQYHSWGSGFAAYLGARWSDPAERVLVARMTAWWLRYAGRQVVSAGRRRARLDTKFALAELQGFLGGVHGYRRSQERMRQRFAEQGQVAPPAPAPAAALAAAGSSAA